MLKCETLLWALVWLLLREIKFWLAFLHNVKLKPLIGSKPVQNRRSIYKSKYWLFRYYIQRKIYSSGPRDQSLLTEHGESLGPPWLLAWVAGEFLNVWLHVLVWAVEVARVILAEVVGWFVNQNGQVAACLLGEGVEFADLLGWSINGNIAADGCLLWLELCLAPAHTAFEHFTRWLEGLVGAWNLVVNCKNHN